MLPGESPPLTGSLPVADERFRMETTGRWAYRFAKATAALCFLFLVFVQVLAGNPFPYSDDWGLVPYAIGVEPLSWNWLWSQHVDHRIPLQKLFHVLLLRAGAFDFRALVFANAVFAYLVTRLLLRAVRSCRGYAVTGDLLFPIVLMNPGFGPFVWGFQLQFMSSVLLTLCVLAFMLGGAANGKGPGWIAAAGCLVALAFCGMNGAVLSGLIALPMLIYLQAVKSLSGRVNARLASALLLTALAAVVWIFLSWRPSDAAGVAADIGFVETARAVLKNWLLSISPRGWRLPPVAPRLYYLLNGMLYISAMALIMKRLWVDRNVPERAAQGPLILAGVMTAALALLLSIAIGRAAYWSPGLELHYGYLAVILPLASWVILSTELPRKAAVAAGLLLLIVYGSVYLENARLSVEWYVDDQRGKIAQVYTDIGTGMSIDAFVDRNIRHFFYMDSQECRRWLKDGILMLKHAGIEPYRRLED